MTLTFWYYVFDDLGTNSLGIVSCYDLAFPEAGKVSVEYASTN